MGSDTPQQPNAVPASQRDAGAAAGHNDGRNADLIIKAGLRTADAARFVGDGHVRGTLAPGKLADFAAYTADPFTCTADELAGLEPALTVVGGRPRHDPGGLAGGINTPGAGPTS
jgi:predicted amidohydrolase YtcJ